MINKLEKQKKKEKKKKLLSDNIEKGGNMHNI